MSLYMLPEFIEWSLRILEKNDTSVSAVHQVYKSFIINMYIDRRIIVYRDFIQFMQYLQAWN